MIFGIGVDAVDISRMHQNISRYGDRFARKILSNEEMEEYIITNSRANFLAKRFAVKEATSKALGTGIRDGLTFRDISVQHDASGRPEITRNKKINKFFKQKEINHAHLSITDEKNFALAFVVLEKNSL